MAANGRGAAYDWSDVTRNGALATGGVELEDVAFSPSRGGGARTYALGSQTEDHDSEAGLQAQANSSRDHYVMSTKNQAAAAMANRNHVRESKLGTMKGVFLPCFQNILGVIVFIRLPYITGQAGIWMTMLILFLSKLTTVLTTLSMSAIATNGTVQAGGPYFIISRNLGVELGGAIGTLFYLGTTIAASLYVLGAVEVISAAFTDEAGYVMQLLSVGLMLCITLIVGVGVRYVNMGAALLLWLVFFSLGSITLGLILFASGVYTGHLTSADRVPFENFKPRYLTDPGAATGIMAGCNRSAVLHNPGRSIPKGTLWAIAATALLYLFFMWFFGCSVAYGTLIDDKLVAMHVAWPTPYLVAVGIVAASLGAAMQCVTGASSLLAAIADDGALPVLSAFASPAAAAQSGGGGGGARAPARAVVATGLIAALPCLAGNLDYITAPITMAFLLMYASVNLSCYVLCVLQSPGFRPQWRYYAWWTALGGVAMCVALMLMISWEAAVVLITAAFALLFYIKYQNATRDWGDTLTGFRYQVARDVLLSLSEKQTMHAKNWRPQVLVLCAIDEGGNPLVPELLSLAGQMKKGRGLLMAVALIKGDHLQDAVRAEEAQGVLALHLKDEKMEGFCKVSVCHDPVDAAITIMHHAGMGTMQPNSVLLAWPDDWSKNSESGVAFVATLRGAVHAHKAVMVLKGAQALPTQYEVLEPSCTVDIWWVAHDGGLLLLVPYLLSLHPTWSRCQLRLFSVIVDPADNPRRVEHDVREYLEQVRINAVVASVDMSDVERNREAYEAEMAGRKQQQARRAPSAQDRYSSSSGGGGDLLDIGAAVNSAAAYTARGGLGELEELEGDRVPQLQHAGSSASGGGGGSRLHQRSGSVGHAATAAAAAAVAAAAAANGGGAHGGAAPKSPIRGAPNLGVEDAGEEGDAEAVRLRRRMTAVLLNRHMRERSSGARLVVTNLPLVRDMAAYDVLQLWEAISEGLKPVLMIRGTGQEVITQFG
ncbi:amino acid permease-domain-containing protein [Tribonema minus]|uniref:Amino acid permease-domain-containing protein n=1 Tax=Tribonema minus TaxID=303371 RepID=A0A835Z2U9_9STRA|nr:amino acid permease-domain-containing protein [Tribonema minus]